ncbi:MAG: hypothetical protein INQ03_22035 [Candidatus Heimdallarchaeota archaeon]|nr:hypothetical protein [Candidatus Heimdallarchaeota archaeon]
MFICMSWFWPIVVKHCICHNNHKDDHDLTTIHQMRRGRPDGSQYT